MLPMRCSATSGMRRQLAPAALLAVHPLGKSPVIVDGSAMPPLLLRLIFDRVAHAWFSGEEFSAADVQMSFPLEVGAARAGVKSGRPKLAAFLDRIHARAAYRRALERGGPYSY